MLLPLSYHNFSPRVGSEHFVDDESRRSALAGTKLKVKFQKQLSEQQLQHHGSQKSAWTSVPARSEVHVSGVHSGELMFGAALRDVFTHFVIPQPVKHIRIRRDFWIK